MSGEPGTKLGRSIGFNSLLLAAFALVTALLLATTYLGTRDTIADAERGAAQKVLLEIFSPEEHDNNLLDDTLPVPEEHIETLGLRGPATIHVVRKDGEVTGFILPVVAPDGYSGDIDMLVGVSTAGRVAGVRVTNHRETPGLGDKIELRKNPWILSFNGLNLDTTQWEVTKDGGAFDQFTGATITPRAVVHRVRDTLVFYREHGEELRAAVQPLNDAENQGVEP